MPELPEVETVRRILEPYVQGKRIESVVLAREKNITTDPNEFVSCLIGKKIESVGRKGKHLLFFLEGDLVMLSHLRMEGKYFEGRANQPLGKFDLAQFNFADGSALIYNDVRKFGTFGLYTKDNYLEVSPIAKLGKEPFNFSEEELFSSLKKKSIPIKEALLDQSIIAGLGNIYVNEVCFRSKIHPLTPAKEISLQQCGDILKHSIDVLTEAIVEGGSTIKSYHPKEGMNGNMQNRLDVYGQENKPCPRCKTPLHKIFVGGRGTEYCPICQKRESRPLVYAVTGPIHAGKTTASLYLESKGYARFDCDLAVSSLYKRKEGKAILRLVVGKKAFLKGELNRSYVRDFLSKNPSKNEELKSKLYPLVKQEAGKFIQAHQGESAVLLEVPLLYGSGLEDLCDFVILVSSSIEARKQRLESEGRDVKNLLSLNKGYPLAYAKAHATWVVENDGSKENLQKRLDEIL